MKQYNEAPAMALDPQLDYAAVVHTNRGTFRMELFADKAPKTVNNFVFLAKDGFYDQVVFHRIIEDFMVQTGDPTGTGSGGPGYRFADELPPAVPYAPGVVAMANAGPNTNGSQFFICTGTSSEFLNQRPNYSVFGRVTEGFEQVKEIAATPVGPSAMGERSRPLEEVRIEQIEIVTAPKN